MRGYIECIPSYSAGGIENMQMTKNLASGIFVTLLGGAYLIATKMLPEVQAGDAIGPTLFPFIIGTCTLICGVALIIQDFTAKDRPHFSFKFVEDKEVWIKIGVCAALGIAYGEFLEPLGYVIATALFMMGASCLINKGHMKQNVLISLSFSLITYIVFATLLELSLPRGLLDSLPF